MIKNPLSALKFSYEMALGAYDPSEFDSFQYSTFVLASIVEIIVMLNVLIAIVSNSF